MSRRLPPLRTIAAAVVALGLTAGITGCTPDPRAEEYRAGTNSGFVSGDGQILEIAEDNRGEPIDFEGVLDTGETVTDEDYAGQVLVVNFWYAECGPCRVEAPILQEVYEEFDGEGATFLGVNTSNSAASSLAFAETFGITYPSALATVDSGIKQAFAGEAPLSATPVTLVLDTEGRVAARIVGPVVEASILRSIVADLLEEA